MRVLPRKRREAIYAVYAFSRLVDNISDGQGSLESKKSVLAAWRTEIDRLYDGCPTHPVTRALVHGVRTYNLPQEEFHALISGMKTDAMPAVRIRTMQELWRYCRQVAGSVGLLCINIFGLGQPPGHQFAVALGNAFQLTNILRDIAEDISLNRLYLPHDLLLSHGVRPAPLSDLLYQPQLVDVCADLAAFAYAEYARAEQYMKEFGWWRTRPPALMKAIYKPTLDALVGSRWTSVHRPVRPGHLRQLWSVLCTGLR